MKLALTKQDITAVICIDSYNIYLCVFATPPAADTVKQKRQLSLRIQFPHFTAANIFINISDMVRNKTAAQFVHGDFSVTTFNERPHGIYKTEPEGYKIIPDTILSFFACFDILFGWGDLTLQNV